MLSFDVMSDLKEAYQVLGEFIAKTDTKTKLEQAISWSAQTIRQGGKLISAGNGGSMCDAQHFAEELTGRYRQDRPSYPAVAICDPSHLTCVANDYGYECVFSRFIEGMGKPEDLFLGISTSGNSGNIIKACEVSKKLGMKTIMLLGKDGGKLKDLCDLPIIVPHSGFADRIQEVHTMIIHIMIRGIEDELRDL